MWNFLFCRAIQASLEQYQSPDGKNGPNAELDYDLQMALMISEKEREKEEQNRINEEKMLEKALELSLMEK